PGESRATEANRSRIPIWRLSVRTACATRVGSRIAASSTARRGVSTSPRAITSILPRLERAWTATIESAVIRIPTEGPSVRFGGLCSIAMLLLDCSYRHQCPGVENTRQRKQGSFRRTDQQGGSVRRTLVFPARDFQSLVAEILRSLTPPGP